MQVHLKVTNLETGAVNNISIEAESEAAALAKYKASPNLSAELRSVEEARPAVSSEFKLALLMIFGGIFGLLLFAAVGSMFDAATAGRPAPKGAIEILIACGVGLPVFLVIFYLRKIASK